MIDENIVWIALAVVAGIWVIWAWRRIRTLTGRHGADSAQASTETAVGRSSLPGSMADFEAQTEAARLVAEAAARQRAAQEESERGLQARLDEAAREEAEQEALQREWDAEVARRAAEDEQARLSQEQVEAAHRAAREQAEAARLKAEHEAGQQAAAAEAARLAAEDEERRRQLAARAAREAARAEAERLAAEAERLAAEAEAARVLAVQEALRHEQQAEAARRAAQEQEVRRREEDAERERQAALAEEQARAADEAHRGGRAPQRARPASPQDTLVMVADDSKVVRVKTSRLLAQHGYRVVLAEDGADAVRKLEVEPPHALITDVDMPGLDGFELTRRVRANPATAHILVVMITAANDRHAAQAASAGVSVLLGKPYPEEQLLARLAGVHTALEAAA